MILKFLENSQKQIYYMLENNENYVEMSSMSHNYLKMHRTPIDFDIPKRKLHTWATRY